MPTDEPALEQELRCWARHAPFDAEVRVLEWAEKAKALQELLTDATLNLAHANARLEHERTKYREQEQGTVAMLSLLDKHLRDKEEGDSQEEEKALVAH